MTKEPVSPGTFTMCGVAAPFMPALRCERNADHANQVTFLTSSPWHRSGVIEWSDSGQVRHDPPPFIPSPLFRGHSASRLLLDEFKLASSTGSGGPPFWGDGPSGMTADPPTPTPAEELAAWWREQADSEIEATVAKAVEYGATDLIDIGRNIARLAEREVDDREAAELGVFFYLEGKFARWRSAIMEGRDVSFDTLFDIGVYVRMAQRIREMGAWPGTDLEASE